MAPCVLILEVVLLNRRFSAKHYASIAVVCLGVAICTLQDLQVIIVPSRCCTSMLILHSRSSGTMTTQCSESRSKCCSACWRHRPRSLLS